MTGPAGRVEGVARLQTQRRQEGSRHVVALCPTPTRAVAQQPGRTTARVKRRTGPMLGFQGFRTARRTLAGVEAMAMLAKGQVRAVRGNDMPAQRAFVHQVFGLAA